MRGALQCPRKNCGELMRDTLDALGRVALVCDACARNRRGLCRDCGRKLHATNRRGTMRCEACAARRTAELTQAYESARYARRKAKMRRWGKRYRARKAIREHRRRYMETYRATHPRDAFDRAYGRAYMAARREDPVYRAQINTRKRELRALKKRERRECAA